MADQLPYVNKITQKTKHSISQKQLTVNYGNGYEQATVLGDNQMTSSWTINYGLVNQSERDTLLAFYREYGNVKSFTWTAFGDPAEKNWIIAGNWSESPQRGDYVRIAFNIREVIRL